MNSSRVALTPLAVNVLSLLDERDMHPYEMIHTIRERHEDKWVKLKPSSLYHQVERMAAAGFTEVAGVERDGNRPERTTYRLTDDGRTALHAWLETTLREVEEPYLPVSLALSELASLPPSVGLGALKARVETLDTAIAADSERIEHARADGVHRMWMLAHEHHLELRKAERTYLRALIDSISQKELTWPEA